MGTKNRNFKDFSGGYRLATKQELSKIFTEDEMKDWNIYENYSKTVILGKRVTDDFALSLQALQSDDSNVYCDSLSMHFFYDDFLVTHSNPDNVDTSWCIGKAFLVQDSYLKLESSPYRIKTIAEMTEEFGDISSVPGNFVTGMYPAAGMRVPKEVFDLIQKNQSFNISTTMQSCKHLLDAMEGVGYRFSTYMLTRDSLPQTLKFFADNHFSNQVAKSRANSIVTNNPPMDGMLTKKSLKPSKKKTIIDFVSIPDVKLKSSSNLKSTKDEQDYF